MERINKEGQTPSNEDQIAALRNEVAKLREELALMPDRIVERMREEFVDLSMVKPRRRGFVLTLSQELLAEDPLLPLLQIGLLVNRSTDHLRHVVRDRELPHERMDGHMVVRPSVILDYLNQVKIGRPRKRE